jgi:hypothetical protein
MGKNKVSTKGYNPRKAWLILACLMTMVSLASASTTVFFLRWSPESASSKDPLSLAEREGTFREMKAELNWPALEFGIEGNALVIEGRAESESQIQQVISLVRKRLKAESFYIVHPYIERPDFISGRVSAVREGDWDYNKPTSALLVVDLMKVAPAPKERRVYNDPLTEAERLLSGLKPLGPLPPKAELIEVSP